MYNTTAIVQCTLTAPEEYPRVQHALRERHAYNRISKQRRAWRRAWTPFSQPPQFPPGHPHNASALVPPAEQEMAITATSGLTSVRLERFDALTVTFAWRANAADPSPAMRVTLTQGSPYITVEYVGATPYISFQNYGSMQSLGTSSGTKFKVGSCAVCLVRGQGRWPVGGDHRDTVRPGLLMPAI